MIDGIDSPQNHGGEKFAAALEPPVVRGNPHLRTPRRSLAGWRAAIFPRRRLRCAGADPDQFDTFSLAQISAVLLVL
jgi:hypothetical protein